MPELDRRQSEQDYEMHKMRPDESLWSVAYEHVLPPHSNASVGRCVENILDNNGGRVSGKDWIKIPFPCDPQDGPELEKQKSEAVLNGTARNIAEDFRNTVNPLDAAWQLSEELVPRLGSLSTSNREYNYLISKIYDQMKEQPFNQGVRVGAEHWNKETSTWDNLYVVDRDYPNSPPVRIVQPSNSVSEIVGDRVNELRRMGQNVDYENYRLRFMDQNSLASDDDLNYMRGKPVQLPY